MDLLMNQSNEPEPKSKKFILISLVISIILLFIVLISMVVITTMTPKELVVSVNGKTINPNENVFIFANEKIYVSLEDISNFIGYSYYNGEYLEFTEDKTKCYLENTYEVATLTLNQKEFYKTPPTTGVPNYEKYTLEEVPALSNDKLYVLATDLAKICNLMFNYKSDSNKIDIYTIDYLTTYYETIIMQNYGYTSISKEFENQKALLHDMAVVEKEGHFGVIKISTGANIIGTKYEELLYNEAQNEFIATSLDKTGIVSADGQTKIGLYYDKINMIEQDMKLYYAENNGLKGILDKNGKVIIYIEYDDIGIDSSLYPNDKIENNYILFNNCIPVKKNDYWGLIDINGKVIHNFEYSRLGYIVGTSKDKTTNNILLITDINGIEGIVVAKKENDIEKYGIINSLGEEIVPCVLEKIYSVTSGGKDIYYIEANGTKLKLEDYLKATGAIKK